VLVEVDVLKVYRVAVKDVRRKCDTPTGRRQLQHFQSSKMLTRGVEVASVAQSSRGGVDRAWSVHL